ncbi:MAG: SDR family NAD(P)-dependent oxidoreductase, partial [Gluconacetobacter diazotrophicus]|nr:SDR family NAD(P)-dependent oxidoreductase [Gluconacetobacter diazotrophicus]
MANPKTFLVTGANKGIGYEIARQLVEKGARVFVGARDAGRGQAAAARLKAEFLPLDVSDARSIDQAIEALSSQVEVLDGLINNAGVLDDDRGTSILDTDPGLIRRTLDTNTFGPLYLTQKLAPLLTKAVDGGRVVNLSSGL